MQIYYFTRTGRSREIAENIAKKYDKEACAIEDGQNWKGPLNFIKGGYMAAGKKDIKIIYKEPDLDDEITLVFPIWAGTFCPAAKTFIENVGRGNIIAIPTSLTTKLKDREGFKEIIDLIGKDIEAPKKI